MRELDVIDVARQDDIKMTMREWTEYYEVVKPRKKILNVISLEFSRTEWVRGWTVCFSHVNNYVYVVHVWKSQLVMGVS